MKGAILFVGNFTSVHGTNRTYSEDMTDRLEAKDWSVLRTSNHASRVARLVDMLRTTWSARKSYRMAHVDVFSGAAFIWAESVCFELRRLGKPYVLTLRGGNLPMFTAKWPRRVRALLRSAALVTTPSKYLKEAIEVAGVAVEVVPNAVDVSAYTYSKRLRVNPRMIWLRAFHSVYNPLMAVEVLAATAHRDTSLTMIGVDKHDGTFEAVTARAAALGVGARLRVIGGIRKQEVPAYLADADIFLNTTDVDNTPISVIEAMASGLCVVSTSVGGIPYLLVDDQDALLSPARDVTTMAAQVIRLLDNSQLAAHISARAREKAVSFDWASVLEHWQRIFERVLARA